MTLRDNLTNEELREIAGAVQWAGHFATLAGDCVAGGPAFSNIAEATRAIESRGVPVYHTIATRRLVDASLPFNR